MQLYVFIFAIGPRSGARHNFFHILEIRKLYSCGARAPIRGTVYLLKGGGVGAPTVKTMHPWSRLSDSHWVI